MPRFLAALSNSARCSRYSFILGSHEVMGDMATPYHKSDVK